MSGPGADAFHAVGDGENGHDEVTELILEKAKHEFKVGRIRHAWEMKRAQNTMEWRRCIRMDADISKCQSEEDHLVRPARCTQSNLNSQCCLFADFRD